MSDTQYYTVDAQNPDLQVIRECGEVIRTGGLVAFPTETVYGLGANALDGEACSKIFRAKGRPQDNPLIVHVADRQELRSLAGSLPALAARCVEVFWPGPLTLVVPKSPQIPDEVTAGLDTVAVRMPNHPVALALIRSSGVPIAAPSANLSGRPSPTLGAHVKEDLSGKIDAILDAGPCPVGVESTVLDLTEEIPVILRPGGVTREQLAEVLGDVKVDPGLKNHNATPRSPGLKYRHYAPRGRALLVEGPADKVQSRVQQELARAREQGLKVGILSSEESAPFYRALHPDYLAVLGPKPEPQQAAAHLFHALRECDRQGIELVLAETFELSGMGLAVMNRLEKAAGYHKITVQ